MGTPDGRRRSELRRDGMQMSYLMHRRSSNPSSTSSDILVTSVPPATLPHNQTPSAFKSSPRARVEDGRFFIVSGVGSLLRKLSDSDRRRTNNAHGGDHNLPLEYGYNHATKRDVDDASFDADASFSNNEGPNHRGTYSKDYTLLHPEIQWVHRGQGRYLPSSALQQQNQSVTLRKPRSKDVGELERLLPRPTLRRRSGEVEVDDEGSHVVSSLQHSSPLAIRTPGSAYSLRGRQSEADVPDASELRSARVHRRARPVFSIENGRSTSVDSESDDLDPKSNKTFPRDYVDAHPEFSWRHCGNGFYKKLTRPGSVSESNNTRRDSSRSFIKTESSASNEVDGTRTFHSSELKGFPREKFRHCGNGWYKLESAASLQQKNDDQSLVQSEAEAEPESEADSEVEEIDQMETFTKEQMLEYRARHPNVHFVHRGNGRWRKTDDVIALFENGADVDNATFDKPYVQAHPEQQFYHCGYGRYKRGTRPSRPSVVSSNDDGEEAPVGLVNKDYVDAHPELEFHHRGQGRYALGPRPKVEPEREPPLSKEAIMEAEIAEAELVDTEYVNTHPEQTFHHRGQGRWARGLPPAGSSNKTAVRGPGAHLAKLSSTPSLSASADANKAVEQPPGLFDLVFRIDGPEKFPNLTWHYRGGGKWSRTSKQDLLQLSAGSGRKFKGKARAAVESPGVQLARETRTADLLNSSTTRYRSNISGVDAPTGTKRKRGSHLNLDDDGVGQHISMYTAQVSKPATPKPQPLRPEEDVLGEEDFPELFREQWSPPAPEEPNDEATMAVRSLFRPLNAPDPFVKALTKHDPVIRPSEVLEAISAHAQEALRRIQDEYLALDKITAPHARIARKPVKGGRVPLERQVAEDRKEAELYDYNFDARKIGYQDPEAQKIIRDAEGRELRKRRNRGALDVESPAVAVSGGDDAPLAPRRAVKPINRFDSLTVPTGRRRYNAPYATTGTATPDPAALTASQPASYEVNGYIVPTTGRWAGHIPKRIRELRGESIGAAKTPPDPYETARGESDGETPRLERSPSNEGTSNVMRKGRPRGSKNLRKRRDAGVPKGPRKKVFTSIEDSANESGEDTATSMYEGMETD